MLLLRCHSSHVLLAPLLNAGTAQAKEADIACMQEELETLGKELKSLDGVQVTPVTGNQAV
jgi:hypothetical protein